MINHLNVIKNFKCLRKTLLRERKDKLQSGGKCLGITYPTQDFPLEGMKNTNINDTHYSNHPIKRGQRLKKTPEQNGYTEGTQTHKGRSPSLDSREIQITAAGRHHYRP